MVNNYRFRIRSIIKEWNSAGLYRKPETSFKCLTSLNKKVDNDVDLLDIKLSKSILMMKFCILKLYLLKNKSNFIKNDMHSSNI